MELTARHKQLLTWVGYPLLALLTFVLTIAYTFPYERLKDRLVTTLEQQYDVSIASLGPTLVPGGIVIDTMMLETRPDEDDDEPAVLVIDRLKARAGLFSMLTGRMSVSFDVRVGEGRLRGSATYGRKGLRARVKSRGLPLDRLPMKAIVGLPMTGGLELDADLELPEMQFGEAEGYFELSCSGCTIGDGKTKIKPRAQARAARGNLFAQSGLTVPKIDLGTMRGEIVMEGGQGRIEELSAVSPDGELYVDGELLLADPVNQSRLPGCIRFRLSEDFAEREPGFGNTNLWMPQRSLQDDGFYAVPTEGTFENFRWNPRKTCEGQPARRDEAPSRGRSRPSITLSPDDDGDRNRRDREPPSISPDDSEEDAGGDKPDDERDDDEQDDRDAERAAERRQELMNRDRSGRTLRDEPEAVDLPEAEEEVIDDEPVDDDDYYEDEGEYEDDEYPDDDYAEEDEYEDDEYVEEDEPEYEEIIIE